MKMKFEIFYFNEDFQQTGKVEREIIDGAEEKNKEVRRLEKAGFITDVHRIHKAAYDRR